jgi:hypothetical protein
MGRMSINQTPRVDVNHGSAAASVTTPPGLAYMTGNTTYGLPATALPVIMNGVVYTPAPMAQLHQQYAAEVQRQRHYAGLGLTPLISQPFQQHAFESSMVPVHQCRLGLQRQYNPDASHYDSHPDSPCQRLPEEQHFQGLYPTTETDAGLSTADVFRPASRGKSRHLHFGRAMWTCWCKGRRRRNCREILKLEVMGGERVFWIA